MAGASVNVVHVLPDLAVAGGPRYVLTVVEGSPPCSVVANHVASLRGGPMREPLEAAGVPTFVLSEGRRDSLTRSVRQLANLVRQHRIDIIHSNGTAVDRLVGQGAAALSGAAFVVSFHGVPLSDVLRAQGAGALPMWRQRGRTVVSRALAHANVDAIVAVSELVARRHGRALGLARDRFTVVPPGLPADALRPPDPEARRRIRAELGVQDEPVLVNVGRFDHGKGQDVLVEALPSILSHHPRTQLVLVGDGVCRPAVEGAARRLGVADHLHFLGTRSDIGAVLAGADIFVVASLTEGFGLAVLEAMAKGLPVVAAHTEINAVTEFVEHERSGLLVAGLDAAAMAEAVVRLLGDGELRPRLARGAVDEARARTAACSTARLESLYVALSEKPRRRRQVA